MGARNHSKLGAGVLVQRELGLRPSEMLALTRDDITLPEQMVGTKGEPRCFVGLGSRGGTKANRQQAVVLRDARLIGIVRWLCECSKGERLVPYSYSQYRTNAAGQI
jgi:integrase